MSSEEEQLRSVALQTAKEIRAARQRAEREVLEAKEALEAKTAELAHSLMMLRAAFGAIGDGIVAVDSKGHITHNNERFSEIWALDGNYVNKPEAAVLAVMSRRCIDPESFLAATTRITQAALPDSFDEIRLTDGRAFERHSKILRIKDEAVGRLWSYREITQRLLSEGQLREEKRMLALLNETGAAMASQMSVQDLIQAVTNKATELCRAEFGAFFFNSVNEQGEAFTLYTLAGAPREAFEKFPLPRATAIFAPTFRGERVVRFDDVRVQPEYGRSPPYNGMPPGHLPVRSYLAVPVVARNGYVHGGLFFGHSQPGIFTVRDELTLQGVAFQAAIAIDNALLFEHSQKTQQQLKHLNETLEQQVEQRTAELTRSERHFQQLVAGVTDYAIFMLDPEGVIVSWNPGAARIKGCSAEEAVGHHFSRFYTEEDRSNGLPNRALHTATTRGKFEGEGWRVRKDGTRFWANVLIDPIRDSNGKLLGFAKVTRDMTEYRAMQEQLHQSQKMEAIGHLTGGVAHDFNNLLTVILGNLEAMWRHLPQENSRLRRAVDQATRGAQRAATLTQQLLAFARRQPLNPKPCDINRLVTDMSDLMRRTLGENVAVETVLAGGLWRVDVDPHQLESAILNLAVNSRDAMPTGGKLTIETANAHLDDEYAGQFAEINPGQYVLLGVSDTGTGMPRDVLARAFDPFFTTKPIGQGTGLGLSQVYGFVKQSNGHIKLYSEPGQGTTVKIYLPRLMEEGAELEVQRIEIIPEGRPNETILVVEDDDDVRIYSTESLRDLKFNVLEASNAETALRVLQEHPNINLLFTDVGLPGLNGRELVDAARKIRPDLKVLFTTGYARNAIVHQGRLDAGVELLTKPFTRSQLALRVREVLDVSARGRDGRKIVLVAEDDESTRIGLVESLVGTGLGVIQTTTAAGALASLQQAKFAAAIIDISLPDGNGLDVGGELRSRFPDLPIVVVGNSAVPRLGRLSGDINVAYVAKPFDAAAIASTLRRFKILN